MRVPAVSGSFYPAEGGLLRDQIRRCFLAGPGEPGECTGKHSITAVVAPHAGYMYSGTCAAHSFKAIAEDGLPEAYIVIGPDHIGVPYDAVMSSEDYCTPLGPCPVHQQIAARLREFLPDDPNAHRREHSIEVELPFIQYIDPDAKIIPIIMGRQDSHTAERIVNAIRIACAGHRVVVVASSDLVHYMPKSVVEKLDSDFLSAVASGNVSAMYGEVKANGLSVCGYGPIAVAMMFNGMGTVEILKKTDSFESMNLDSEAVVGYGSLVMRN